MEPICTITCNKFQRDEVRNEITEFLDKYLHNYDELNEEYKSLMSVYFDFDIFDIRELLIQNNKEKWLIFRVPGATRGGFLLKEINRYNDQPNSISIRFEIIKIEFIEDTCFKVFNIFSRDVIDASNNEFLNKEIIIRINS